MNSDAIYLTGMEIKDLGGIKHFAAQLGAINLIVGENGCGKSTCLDAVKTVFEGGSAPSMVRLGCEEGSVELSFSNGYTALKTVKLDGYDLKVRTPEGGDAKRPAELLKEWAPSLSFDPLAFLAADPKEKTAFLLRTLPLTFTADEVNAALDAVVVTGDVNLTKFNEIRDGRYADRTKLNADVKSLEATIQEFRRSLPGDGEEATDWAATVTRLSGVITDAEVEKSTIKGEIDLEAEQERSRIGTASAAKIVALREQIAELGRQITAVESEEAVSFQHVEIVAGNTLKNDTAAVEEKIVAAKVELATAQSNAEQHTRAAGTRQAIETRKVQLQGHISQEMRLSAAIKAMDLLKVEKLKKLPIDGLDIRVEKTKPVILINGVALERLNRQLQIFVAIQAVSKASGKMPLILCEAAELDSTHLAELEGAAKDAGLQMLLARWKDGAPLQLESGVAA